MLSFSGLFMKNLLISPLKQGPNKLFERGEEETATDFQW